ncbi:Hypothetical_protein [Hexamita inflata]|uniref:Hypothetical_protein n=1 Tax=Hexamita inflata TaxID=28002 RepID=A0AA86RHR7_9EUKA|nr:Hypothetical protein HINF_LOCUS65765 [Hexamita inflata]CAI9978122.1 Hypothetical protein HINF_LOCUS65767 [Hexamita inflata]
MQFLRQVSRKRVWKFQNGGTIDGAVCKSRQNNRGRLVLAFQAPSQLHDITYDTHKSQQRSCRNGMERAQQDASSYSQIYGILYKHINFRISKKLSWTQPRNGQQNSDGFQKPRSAQFVCQSRVSRT